jgi:hypothetical protein
MTYNKALQILGLSANYGVIELKDAAQTKFRDFFKSKDAKGLKFDDIFWAYEMLYFFHDHEQHEIEEDLEDWQYEEADLKKKLIKQKKFSKEQFLVSKYYKSLNTIGTFFDSLAFIILVGSFSLPFILGQWKSGAGTVIGIIGFLIIFLGFAKYFTNIKGFRWSRCLQNFGIICSKTIFWATLFMVINILCLPTIIFRFAVAHIPLLFAYIGFSLVAVGFTKYFNRKESFFKYFVPMALLPSLITAFFLVGFASKSQLPKETYSFEPLITEWGDSDGRGTNTAVLYLEDNAYENAIGIRFFVNDKGFKGDSIELYFSKTMFGHKYLESWEFK